MKFIPVDDTNILELFKLNKELAKKEKQLFLFTAKKKEYKRYFLNKHPIVFAYLIYHRDEIIGFVIYVNKFASYLGKKVLLIEDMYLKKSHQKFSLRVLQYMIEKAKNKNYARVELRVLKMHGLKKSMVKKAGFAKIKKWDTYRYEN